MIDFGLSKVQEQAVKPPLPVNIVREPAQVVHGLPKEYPRNGRGGPREVDAEQPSDTPTLDALKEAVDDVNAAVASLNQRIHYSVDSDTHQVTAQVVDSEGKKVVREIPPKELLEMRKRFSEITGKIFDQEA